MLPKNLGCSPRDQGLMVAPTTYWRPNSVSSLVPESSSTGHLGAMSGPDPYQPRSRKRAIRSIAGSRTAMSDA